MRVLIIEDYAPIRNSVAQGLREAGFAVDTAADGSEGLWYAESSDYDVVVLDLMLPKLDGLSLLERLRRGGRSASVLVLTAKDSLADRVRGLDLGADDYLVKPFAFDELLARVRAMVRRKYGIPDPVIQVGDLTIQTASRIVTRGQAVIELTAREYALLEYLATRAGQIVSRTEIWEHVYEFESDTLSNVVDVYISRLRKKIDPPGQLPLIHTRRGQGYLLDELS